MNIKILNSRLVVAYLNVIQDIGSECLYLWDVIMTECRVETLSKIFFKIELFLKMRVTDDIYS